MAPGAAEWAAEWAVVMGGLTGVAAARVAAERAVAARAVVVWVATRAAAARAGGARAAASASWTPLAGAMVLRLVELPAQKNCLVVGVAAHTVVLLG